MRAHSEPKPLAYKERPINTHSELNFKIKMLLKRSIRKYGRRGSLSDAKVTPELHYKLFRKKCIIQFDNHLGAHRYI